MDLIEQVQGANKGLTITLDRKDIIKMVIWWDPSWARKERCQADITFKKNDIVSKITLKTETLPELFSKLQTFLLSL